MRLETLASLPLCCPACRDDPRGAAPLSLHVDRVAQGEVVAGQLRCPRAGCAVVYPLRDGVPLLHPLPDRYCESERLALQGELELGSGRGHEFLAAYSWTAWADRIPLEPAVADLQQAARLYRQEIARALAELVAEARRPPGGLLLDAGCGLGREVWDLAGSGLPTLGLDLRYEALRLAAAAGRDGRARWLEQPPGRARRWHDVPPGPPLRGDQALFLVGDASQPPLPPGSVAGLAALNLLDSTTAPRRVLDRLVELLRPGGLLLLTTPFAWRAELAPGGLGEARADADDEAQLLALLTGEGAAGLGLTLADGPRDLRWVLRKHAREHIVYSCWLLLLRKG